MRHVTIMMAALLVAGCGSTTSRVARLERTIEEQREIIASLQAERLTGVRAESASPLPSPPPQAGEGERVGVVPPPASRPMPIPVTPQHWGSMHGAPPVPGGCPGILSLTIENRTEYYISVLLDGVAVQVGGGSGILPHLPPGQRVDVCLTRPGRHTVMGVGFARRGAELVEVGRFSEQVTFDQRSVHTWGRQQYILSSRHFR